MLDPHMFRRTRYNLFAYDGRLLGDAFANSAREAAEVAACQGYPVAYARIPRIGGC